jgi:hypothetical protein
MEIWDRKIKQTFAVVFTAESGRRFAALRSGHVSRYSAA